MKNVEIYTDGACSGNPGIGGWAAILIYKDKIKTISGGFPDTTNNRMELYSIIQGILQLKEPCMVNVYSDSAYVVESFNQGWITKWVKNGWINAGKKEVKNRDLWNHLLSVMKEHQVNFIKVKGHSDNEYNNKCDEMARKEILKISNKLI